MTGSKGSYPECTGRYLTVPASIPGSSESPWQSDRCSCVEVLALLAEVLGGGTETWRRLTGGCREDNLDRGAVVRGSDVKTLAVPPLRNCITGGGNDPVAADRWGRHFRGRAHQWQSRLAV